MRFTTSKEAGDPYAHFRGCADDALFVGREEIREVLLQFPRYNVFLQLLLDISVFILPDNDNALNLSVNRLCKHFPNQHFHILLNVLCGRPDSSYLL